MKGKGPERVFVKLLDGNHTHAGERCAKGSIIPLRPDQAAPLVNAGRGEIVSKPEEGNVDAPQV